MRDMGIGAHWHGRSMSSNPAVRILNTDLADLAKYARMRAYPSQDMIKYRVVVSLLFALCLPRLSGAVGD